LKQIVGAVLDHPNLSSAAIARHLGTTASVKLVQEKSLGFLEIITRTVVVTEDILHRRLQEAAERALFVDPSGSTVLDVFAALMNRSASRQ
jgi:hypothetical protein